MSYKRRTSEFLKGFRKFSVGPKAEALVIEEHLRSLDCPRALTVWILFKTGEHAQLAALGFDPLNYASVKQTRDAYAATKFLSKFEGLTLGYDLDEVAFTKFRKFEELCKRTNQRFRDLSADPLFRGSVVHIHNGCVRKIERILGDWNTQEFFSRPDWGPGATTLIKRRDASPEVKFQCEIGITRDLHSLLPVGLLEGFYPRWAQHLAESGYPHYQIGNKVVTVPKDARANRVIAIEPGLNLFFQKSIGEMLRRRLLVVGVDTRNQGKNQEAARWGSINLSTATLDLSSASDSISTGLVRELLPPRWFDVMDACRSQYGMLEKEQIRWAKFSSMGNGFTFPLQSLIFYALSFACCEYVGADPKKICVYGDDIIIPVKAVEQFAAMLEFYGFQLNEDKSFVNSCFRESCGAHYVAGVDVKPIYLKGRISSVLSVYKLANAIRRSARSRNCFLGCDIRFKKTFAHLVSLVPQALRLWIPETLGDGGFIGNFDEAHPTRASHGIEGYYVKSIALKSNKRLEERPGYLLAELWRIDARTSEDWSPRMPPRLLALNYARMELTSGEARKNLIPASSSSLSLVRSLVPQWVDLGPWTESLVDHL